jgi:abequosyltransferase
MQHERPLLTIAIPTYNRSASLAQLLSVLEPQLVGETRVELLISDNASPDDTPSVVESFRKNGLAVIYSRNEANIGPDANFIRLYEMAKGEYVWVFGDDDVIVPGGLKEVLRRLETREFDLLYVRAKGFRDQYDALATPGISRRIKTFSRPQDYALHVSTGLTFISGNIIRKAAVEREPHGDFHKLVGTNLGQLSYTFAMLRAEPRCAVLLDFLVASRVENSGGHGTCEVFGTNLRRIVDESFGLDSPVGRAILNRTIQVWFPWAMLLKRRVPHSNYFPEDAESILKGLFHDNPRYWIFLYPVLRLPLPLATAWRLMGRVVSQVDRLLGYPISR